MARERARLVSTHHFGGSRAWTLERPVTVVGRARTCDIRLGSASVAKVQCVILRDRGHLRFHDLTGDGLEVNKQAAVEGSLRDGDEIRIGRFQFQVEIPLTAGAPPFPEPARGVLVATGPSADGERLPLQKVATLVGSDPERDLVLGGEHVAPYHCLFVRASPGIYLRDLESGKHTLTDGEYVQISLLDDADEIVLGSHAFQMQIQGTVDLPVSEADATVLIVDDDLTNLQLLERALRKSGYAVRKAGTSRECLDHLSAEPIDAVLLEAAFPDTDSLDLCKAIKSDPRRSSTLVILMISDLLSDRMLAAGFEAGACDFVLKPFSRAEILARVGSRLEEKRARDRLHEMSHVDALTGLRNRRALEKELDRAISQARTHRLAVSLIMTDLDYFKRCNDRYGHDFGDRVLRDFARVLQEGCDEEHIVARFGGEEFCIILPRTTLEQGKAHAELLRQNWADTAFSVEGESCAFTASFGVSGLAGQATRDDVSPELLVRTADQALYKAKGAGRNCVVGSPCTVAEPGGRARPYLASLAAAPEPDEEVDADPEAQQ